MSLGWSEIAFPSGTVDGEPVRGSTGEVDDVVTMFRSMRDAADEIHDQFETLKEEGADSTRLRGDSATQFREIIDAVAGTLSHVPEVADAAYTVMNDHLGKLEDLHTRASEALARANTRWEDYESAQGAASAAGTTSTRLQGQADSLPADDPGVGDADTAASDAASALTAALGLADDARSDLEASKTEWGDLRGDEDSLNSETAGELDDIDLGDLEDPSWWESLLGAAFDLLMDLSLLDELFALIEAIATGDWAAALWALKDILDTVMLIVAVVALFTPLGPLVLVLSAIYMATTLTLYATQWPNPETGQTVGLLDVGLAGLDLIPFGRLLPPIGGATPPPGSMTPPTSAATPPVGSATPPPGSATPPGTRTPGPYDDVPLSQLPTTYRRPSSYRTATRRRAWDNAAGPDGTVRDPLTGRPIDPSEPWDMGHIPGHEFQHHARSAANRGISREEFLDEYNQDIYRPELPSSNRNHQLETGVDEYEGP
ncbi:MAG: GH-E family nuclease [Actinomycetota bacterium]|nr:GH-E family nuclease [Actinomycetota bacterium]